MSESHYAPYHIKLMSSSTKERTSEINTARQKRVSNVLPHINCPFLERRSFLYNFRDSDFSFQGLKEVFLFDFIVPSLFYQYIYHILLEEAGGLNHPISPTFRFSSLCGTQVAVSHLIIFNYRSLQSSEKNVGQTSSTIFLFQAERRSKSDRWETSLMCVYLIHCVQSGHQSSVPFN